MLKLKFYRAKILCERFLRSTPNGSDMRLDAAKHKINEFENNNRYYPEWNRRAKNTEKINQSALRQFQATSSACTWSTKMGHGWGTKVFEEVIL